MFSKKTIVTPKRKWYYFKKEVQRYNLELLALGAIALLSIILIVR